MGLLGYAGRRALQMVPVLVAIVVINFVLVHAAPGDPAQVLAGPFATREYVEQLRHSYGLDQALPVQFLAYVGQLLHGDLGRSYSFNAPVLSVIAQRIPATLLLVLSSQALGLALGTALGTIAARAYPSRGDGALSVVSLAAYSMPIFWLGMLLILLFAVSLHVLPSSGMRGVFSTGGGAGAVADVLQHLLLPVVTLTVAWTIPTYLRLARASVIEVRQEDYITTARAKGLKESVVFFKHALRNALLPVVTVAGLYVGLSLSGAVLTETVFGWPGVGQLMYQAIFSRDYPILMGIFVLTSFGVVAMSLITDVVYAFLDPRVTY
jgi:peptide/nickel transport system permease protein